MPDWQDELLGDWRRWLERARSRTPLIAEVRFSPGTDDEGHRIDRNQVNRAKVLWALQFDRRREDAALVRDLFREEIAWHRQAPFQGLAEELTLAAHLVAADADLADVGLMWQAKTANFDTWCGFDSCFLGAAGVEEAVRAARAEDPVDDELLTRLVGADGTLLLTDEDVANHRAELAEWFPPSPDADPPSQWFERACLTNELDHAAQVLEAWMGSSEPPSPAEHRYALGALGRYGEAVEVQRRIAEHAGGPRGDLRATLDLAGLERAAGDVGGALTTLRRCRRALRSLPDAPGNLLRSVAEEGFRLAIAADGRVAARAFRLAEEIAQDRRIPPGPRLREGADPPDERLPLVILEAARDAARHVGAEDRALHYDARAERERARIDDALRS